MEIINAQAFECPKPLVMAKLALEKQQEIQIDVNCRALRNLGRLSEALGASFEARLIGPNTYRVHIVQDDAFEPFVSDISCACGSCGSDI